MRWSRYYIPTLREDPSDAEVVSHRLMLKAGMIRKVAAGVHDLLPLGLRCIRKIENIVREEMNRAGAHEVLLPMVIPSELWQETGRWDVYGKELLRFQDRHDRSFCLGPTHEEVITDLVRRDIRSHRQLPVTLYQIQTKFRDEIRPRFGLMRGREFIMKDAYSFDKTDADAEASYRTMVDAYHRIFSRCGLRFQMVEADPGNIGGSFSHEFMVLAETGEDQMIVCDACRFAANVELTGGDRTGAVASGFSRTVSARLKPGATGKGTPDVPPPGGRGPASPRMGAGAGKSGATGPKTPGGQESAPACPKCGQPARFTRGIEVGHVFKLGDKYSKSMKAVYLDEAGAERLIVMGCYGIGIGRTLAAAIEQGHDANGPILTPALAPFDVLITSAVPDPRVAEAAEKLERQFAEVGLDALWDDRDERAGVKFKDGDLTGIPLKIIIGKKLVEKGLLELKKRSDGSSQEVPAQNVAEKVREILSGFVPKVLAEG